ncbi:MAG: Alpha-N-arabinofuranosidase [Pedosphaera sp.]|nr:Alpha-N-arabinofuranosidase [Pedosphaera sp.]
MIFHEGFYYYCESKNHQRNIMIRKSRTIAGVGQDPAVCVWSAPAAGRNANAIWAPELHRLGNRWFIYYAADDGRNKNHRMWVLESQGDDPLGKYHCRGEIQTGGWSIDGTVFTQADGRMFFIWSGWPGRRNGQQNLYIAPMQDPLTLAGPRMLLCTPDRPWERSAMPICEGPQVLQRNGNLFIVYSASGSWTPDYCLGLLHNPTGDVMNPAAWQKHGPVFQKTEHVWGVGHCSFVKSLCQTEDWIIYHSKSALQHGWKDRDVHAKRFTWTPEGLPDFGTPPPRGPAISPTLAKPAGSCLIPIAA